LYERIFKGLNKTGFIQRAITSANDH